MTAEWSFQLSLVELSLRPLGISVKAIKGDLLMGDALNQNTGLRHLMNTLINLLYSEWQDLKKNKSFLKLQEESKEEHDLFGIRHKS